MRRRLFVVCLAALCGRPVLAADPELKGLVEAGRFRRAQPLLEAAVAANANDAEAAWLLSRLKMALGDADGALSLAEKAATLQPRNATYRHQVAEVVGRQAQQASVFRQMGLARRVKREAEAALSLDPTHLGALDTLMQFHLQAPGIAGGDAAQARVLAARIKAVSAPDGFLAEADLAIEAKQTARLAELYRAAVTAGPTHAGARRALANYLLLPDTRNWAEAETHARELVTLAPDRADSYAALASALAGQRKIADLDATIATGGTKVPENRLPAYRAGNALLATNAELPRAEGYFRQYLTQPVEVGMPSHAAAHWRLALVLEKLGRRADAVVLLRQAVAGDPKLEGAKADLRRLQ